MTRTPFQILGLVCSACGHTYAAHMRCQVQASFGKTNDLKIVGCEKCACKRPRFRL